MAMLDRGASGTQHARWGQQILATIAAYDAVAKQPAFSYLLTPDAVAALSAEHERLATIVARLVADNAAYRAYLDQGFLETRALQRVADFVCDEGQRAVDSLTSGKDEEVARHVTGGIKALRKGHVLSRVLRAGKTLTVSLARGTASLVRILPTNLFGDATVAADRLDAGADLLDGYLETEAKTIEARRVALRAAVRKANNDLREALEQMNGRLRTHVTARFIDSLYPALSDKGRKVGDAPDEDDDEPEPASPAATDPSITG